MAKYDWKQLEKEYILSEYKSVSSFLKDKGIKQSRKYQKINKRLERKKGTKRGQKRYQNCRKSYRKSYRKRKRKRS